MSDLARLPSYPSPTTLIARSGIQFLDFGFDATKLRVREWGFHDAKSAESVDDLVQLDFDEAHGQYEVVESGRRRAAEPNLVVTAKDALAPFLDKWVPVPFLQMRPNNQFREGPADWARIRVVDLEARIRPPQFDQLPPDVRELSPGYRAANPEGTKRWLEVEKQSRTSRPTASTLQLAYATPMRNQLSLALFEQEGIEPEFEALPHRRVPLPSGGTVIIERTEALWAIDVNTGRNVSGSSAEARKAHGLSLLVGANMTW